MCLDRDSFKFDNTNETSHYLNPKYLYLYISIGILYLFCSSIRIFLSYLARKLGSGLLMQILLTANAR